MAQLQYWLLQFASIALVALSCVMMMIILGGCGITEQRRIIAEHAGIEAAMDAADDWKDCIVIRPGQFPIRCQ